MWGVSDYFGDGGDVLAAVVFPASLLLCFVALLVNSVDSRRSKTKQTIGEQTATQQYTLGANGCGGFGLRVGGVVP
jgi:hypothetical protein